MKDLFSKIIGVCFVIFFMATSANVAVAATRMIAPPLSPQATISLMTSSPCDDEIYAVYGHTAIRVHDAEKNIDAVFNYGIFDFSKPNFLYRFAKGETDYMLGVYDFNNYLIEYQERGSEVCEQVLNLSPEEKEAIWQALVQNAQPENRVYRYNFFFDNCSTRPSVIIEKNLQGKIIYESKNSTKSFRDEINHCTRNHPWITFGCDLIMGWHTDRTMTFKETFFLPLNLEEAFAKAKVSRNGAENPLVEKTNILAKETAEHPTPSVLTSPLACCIALFLIVLLLTIVEIRKQKYYRIVDCVLFFVAGVAGCIMYFLSFMSVHPCMFPNIELLWLHPFHFVGVIFFSVKKYNNAAFWYHFINFAAILTMCVAWIFVPQHFNIAFIPLIATFLLRSGWAIYRKKLSIE